MIQLTRRERRLGIGMMAVGLIWALYGFVIEPMQDRIQTLQRVIPEKQAELQEAQAVSERYLTVRREFDRMQQRMAEQDSDFQLLPFLETLIERQQLTPYATMERDMRPSEPGYSETVVEIGLEGIALKQLVRFLEAVENSGVLAHVGSLYIRKNSENTTRLDTTIQIQSPRLTPNVVAVDTPRL